MKKRLLTTAILGLMAELPLGRPALSEVAVQFVAPQRYADADSHGYGTDRSALRTLEGYFGTLGDRCLKPGERLEVKVLNVDLAGQPEWWHSAGSDIRVMRDVTWPRMDLDYVWRDSAGQVLAQAQNERLADMDYLRHSLYVRASHEPLPYEKAMQQDWFERRFCRSHG